MRAPQIDSGAWTSRLPCTTNAGSVILRRSSRRSLANPVMKNARVACAEQVRHSRIMNCANSVEISTPGRPMPKKLPALSKPPGPVARPHLEICLHQRAVDALGVVARLHRKGVVPDTIAQTQAAAAYALALFLVALSPANIHAARARVVIAGRRATPSCGDFHCSCFGSARWCGLRSRLSSHEGRSMTNRCPAQPTISRLTGARNDR